MNYDGEQTWKKLNPELVVNGEREELARFKKMGVYEYTERERRR